MSDLEFTLQDCDDVLKHCLAVPTSRAKDFEIIPRQNNYILIITTEETNKRVCLYVKSNSKPPLIDKIFYDGFKTVLKTFRSTITPKFFCSKSELLFYEDLTCQRFQTNPGLFDLKHIQQVCSVLAEFHAAGFAYEKIKEEKLIQKYELDCCYFNLEEVEDLLWFSIENKERLNEVRQQLAERQLTNCSKTICHGNLSWSNILFHYENGVPDQCKLLNFKAIYGSPVYDVLQLVFFNTNEEFRKHHLDDVLKFYCTRLEEELKTYDLNINKVFASEELKLSCNNVLPLVKLRCALLKPEEKKSLKEVLEFPRITKEDCYTIIRNVIKSCDYDLLSFQTKIVEGKSNKRLLKIKIKTSLEDKTISSVVKSKSNQECFTREAFIFCTFLPKLHQLEVSLINDILPVCYLQNPEDIVLEDLSLQNYQTVRHFDFTILSLVIKKLAKFHANSLVFEEKMSENYRLINDYKLLERTFFNTDKLIDIIDLFPEFKIDENLRNLIDSISKPSTRFRNVVSHGFLSNNNILIKFDGENPIDCRFINFENIKYCPPALDFLTLIYLTDKVSRIRSEEVLKKIYHDELGRILASYSCNVQKYCSYQEFEDSLEHYRIEHQARTLLYRVEENAPDIKEANWKTFLGRKCENPIFKARLKKDIVELYDVLHNIKM